MRSIHFAWLFSLVPAIALAQEPVHSASPRQRTGLELALGLQGGEIQCESQMGQCDGFTEAGGGNLSAAWFFGEKLGIALDLWAMSHSNDGFTFTHYVNTVGVKWRPLKILTLTGGIGAAHASLSHDNTNLQVSSDDGAAVMGAASLDLIRSRRWALAVEARFGTGFYGDEDEDGMADIVGRNVGVGAHFAIFGF